MNGRWRETRDGEVDTVTEEGADGSDSMVVISAAADDDSPARRRCSLDVDVEYDLLRGDSDSLGAVLIVPPSAFSRTRSFLHPPTRRITLASPWFVLVCLF
jgi:hypothetical protein